MKIITLKGYCIKRIWTSTTSLNDRKTEQEGKFNKKNLCQ